MTGPAEESIVRHMPNHSATLDDVFHALSDYTRRAVVERLGEGAQSTSLLARHYDMSLPSFTQHLGVLERAGLIGSDKQGRVRTYHLVRDNVLVGEEWFVGQRDLWERRLDELDAFVTGPLGS